MKTYLFALVCAAAAAPALADAAADTELLSAQVAYQQALKAHTNYAGQIGSVQARLQAVQAVLAEKQQEAQMLQQQLGSLTQNAAQSQAALEAAGARLDKAWLAVRGR